MNKVVDLKWIGALALAINFNFIPFKISLDLKPLGWTNLKKISSPSGSLNLIQTSSGKSDMRNYIALPLFIVDTIRSSSTIQGKDLLINVIAETNSFDLTHKG